MAGALASLFALETFLIYLTMSFFLGTIYGLRTDTLDSLSALGTFLIPVTMSLSVLGNLLITGTTFVLWVFLSGFTLLNFPDEE